MDSRIDFYAVLAPTWSHLGPQVGAILALKIAQEPPRTPPNTHLGARTRPDPQNGSKMTPRPPKMPLQTTNFGSIWASFWHMFATYITKTLQKSPQARWRVRSSAALWIY